MSIPFFHAVWTALLLAVFVGIVVWVYVIKRRSDFERQARMPLDEDDDETPRRRSEDAK